MQLLSCKNVSIKYESVPVIKDVSLEVDSGDYLCIVGENGSGKSTLMKGLLGLMKTLEGEIRFHGLKRTEIGYLPQQTVVQKDFPANVFEVVLSGCLNRHGFFSFYGKTDKERAIHCMESLGIEALKMKSYRELSGGQQQRVLLARALCATEKLLMLDEPVAGLDPKATMEMYELLEKLNRERGIAIIMISHDIKSSVEYGNKLLHLQKTPIFYGTVMEYEESEIGGKMLGLV